jgi:ATP synthase protein I
MQEQDARILRAAAIPTAIAGIVLLVLFTLLDGGEGFLGALFGVAVVGAFFSASLIVTSYASRRGPTMLMGAAMATYLVKIVLLGVLLVSLRDTTAFDFQAFGISILVGMVVWLTGQVRAFMRMKTPYVEPGTPGWLR